MRLQPGGATSRSRSSTTARRVRRLITGRSAAAGAGCASTWDGRDDAGRRVPDGTYAIKLRARAGRKQFNTTRSIVIDTGAPRPAEMTVESATLGEAGEGECRRGLRLARPRLAWSSRPCAAAARSRCAGSAPARCARTSRSAGAGTAARADGGAVPPGLYVIRASLFDAAAQPGGARAHLLGRLPRGRARPRLPSRRASAWGPRCGAPAGTACATQRHRDARALPPHRRAGRRRPATRWAPRWAAARAARSGRVRCGSRRASTPPRCGSSPAPTTGWAPR